MNNLSKESISLLPDLSTKTKNLLNKYEIKTIGDLLLWNTRHLEDLKGFGKYTIKEIKRSLDLSNLSLSNEIISFFVWNIANHQGKTTKFFYEDYSVRLAKGKGLKFIENHSSYFVYKHFIVLSYWRSEFYEKSFPDQKVKECNGVVIFDLIDMDFLDNRSSVYIGDNSPPPFIFTDVSDAIMSINRKAFNVNFPNTQIKARNKKQQHLFNELHCLYKDIPYVSLDD